ncbi:PFGI-1 class ICE element type IV pilus protein PilL2 [Burkholderia pseudomallei]
MPSSSFRCVPHALVLAIALAATCVTACAMPAQPSALAPLAPVTLPEPASTPSIPVVRYGRYTLIELTPDDGQRDLMRQVIDLTVPAAAHATVGDALHYVLRRSGYRLCDAHAGAIAALVALPLPAAHEHLGPITLRDALQLLAGPRWSLRVDDETREVCFAPLPENRPASQASAPASPDDPPPLMHAEPISDPVGDPT